MAKIHNVVPLMTPYSLVGMHKRSDPSSGQFILCRWRQNLKRNVGTIVPHNTMLQQTTKPTIISFLLIMSAWIVNAILYHTLKTK